jgi:hypothetical protein
MDSQLLQDLAELNDNYLELKESLQKIKDIMNNSDMFDYEKISYIRHVFRIIEWDNKLFE